MTFIAFLAIALLCAGFMAQAARAEPSPALTVSAGTLGGGADIAVPLTDDLALRLSLSGASLPRGLIRFGDRSIEGRVLFAGGGIDWSPGGGVYVGLGVLRNLNSLTFHGQSDEIMGITAPYKGTVKFQDWAPYGVVGYRTALDEGGAWSIGVEAGLLYQGKARTSITSSHPLAADPVFVAVLEEERQKAQHHADKLDLYPILRIALTYRF